MNIDCIYDGRFGIEREALRINQNGEVALSSHPKSLEENKCITKDFAESQIEIVTPPKKTIDEAVDMVIEIEDFIYKNIDDEYLWRQSNPPIIKDSSKVRIAQFPDEKEKEDYRNYLLNKYKIPKSIISGTHFNISFGDDLISHLFENSDYEDFSLFKNKIYLKISKYLLKDRWFLTYLTNASPKVDETFYDPSYEFSDLSKMSSLRNSIYGYRNDKEIVLDYESAENYTKSVNKYIEEKIITSSSELYVPVRPKFNGSDNIEYIEIRFLDINPFVKGGVSRIDLKYIHLYCIYRLFSEDFLFTKEEQRKANNNHDNMAQTLYPNEEEKSLMIELNNEIKKCINQFKEYYNNEEIFSSVEERINNPEHTYSNMLLTEYDKSNYIEYHLEQAINDKNKLLN